jgi:hypothetical protein
VAKKSTGYLGNPNLKKIGIQHDWTEEMQDEWIKCSTDPIYFTENYIKIINLNDGLVNFRPYNYQREIIQSIHDDRFNIILTGRQSGKALSINEYIPTPSGFKTMGELNVGDIIFDNNGNESKITFATDVMYGHKCYNITFDNDEVIKCDAEHLWVVEVKGKKITKTTEELVPILDKAKSNKGSVKIRGHNGVDYSERTDLLIPPYILGYWLGDGYSDGGRISVADFDYDSLKNKLNEYGYTENGFIRDNRSPHAGRIGIDTLYSNLKSLGVYKNKHIPESYILSSKNQRIQLIQGLMDSDGHVDKKGSCEFYNKNESIINSVRVILASLGVKSTKREKLVNGETYYIVSYTTDKFIPVTIPRKSDRILSKKQRNSRQDYNNCYYIKHIDECESVPVRCIKVDATDSMFLTSKSYIPTHNTTSLVASILHYVIFNDEKTVALLANKGDTAREILGRIQIAYEALPTWLQQGIVEYNKGSMELENNSRIIAGSTSSSSIRGYSISFLYIDECAFVENWEDFYRSVYPTISSGRDTKVVFTSTPNGINHYHKLWNDAVENRSKFIPIKVTWKDVPGRDEIWKEDTIANTSQEAFTQEHEAEFIGSSGTLIDGWKLKELSTWNTIKANKFTRVYEAPIMGKEYVLVADVSRGKGIDNSAFSVISVSTLPYKLVATYACDTVPPDMYAEVIYQAHIQYNNALVLVENNDAGCETLRVLNDTYECETILGSINGTQAGDKKRISINGGQGFEFGIRTTKSTKAIGCARLKILIENNTLLLGDKLTIDELNTFSRKGTSYEAEQGNHDDTVMSLVMFAWLTTQDIFEDLVNINTRQAIRDKFESRFEEELSPFGYVFNGIDDEPDYNIQRDLLGYSVRLPSYDDYDSLMGLEDDSTTFLSI